MTTKKKQPPETRPAHPASSEALRRIPSVEKILSDPGVASMIRDFGRETVKSILVGHLMHIRREGGGDLTPSGIATAVAARLSDIGRSSLERVINGSGIVIHTNLGRSPIDPVLWSEAGRLISGYSNLEYSLATGERGSRDGHVSALASRLFGCEAAILTNNNAAATLLLLAALAPRKEVIVSRGELVEIGGSFRIPEVIQQGGAILREVGTTNRTRREDYLAAVSRKTAAILLVKRSNFDIVGFTERPTLEDLVSVSAQKRLPLLYDEGSGLVVDLAKYGFARSPTIRELFALGVDAVCCSTDKLIGATQGGLILGKKEIIDRCRRHPLMRALRAGKESYAVVTETLRAFLNGSWEERIPIYRMLATPLEALRKRAEAIADETGAAVAAVESALGGGTTPTESIRSAGLELRGDAAELSRSLVRRSVPVIGRIRSDRFTIDLRTVAPEEDRELVEAIREVQSPVASRKSPA